MFFEQKRPVINQCYSISLKNTERVHCVYEGRKIVQRTVVSRACAKVWMKLQTRLYNMRATDHWDRDTANFMQMPIRDLWALTILILLINFVNISAENTLPDMRLNAPNRFCFFLNSLEREPEFLVEGLGP